MKNKTKLVLGLSILTAAALTAGATGTFAWFTTNRKATATFNHITAKSVEGSLTITMGALTGGMGSNATTNGILGTSTTATLTGATTGMTDVSSQDGVTFAHPNWTDKAGNDQPVKGIANVSDIAWGKKGYWTAYYIGLQNDGGNSADVYLNKGSQVVAATATDTTQSEKNTAAASWTRVAINLAGNASATAGAPDSLKASETKVIQGSQAKTFYVAPDEKATKCTTTTASPTALDLEDIVTSTKDYSGQLIVTIPAGQIQYLTVSVWLEGTASDKQDSAIGGIVNVELDFAALTHTDA